MSPHLLPCGVIWSLLGAGDEAACFKIDFIVTQVVGAGTDQKTTALEKNRLSLTVTKRNAHITGTRTMQEPVQRQRGQEEHLHKSL